MKIKIIINSLLIIFVLHLLLENIDFNVQIGDQSYENMSNTNNKYNNTLDFLGGNDDNDTQGEGYSMKENLLNYVKSMRIKMEILQKEKFPLMIKTLLI